MLTLVIFVETEKFILKCEGILNIWNAKTRLKKNKVVGGHSIWFQAYSRATGRKTYRNEGSVILVLGQKENVSGTE